VVVYIACNHGILSTLSQRLALPCARPFATQFWLPGVPVPGASFGRGPRQVPRRFVKGKMCAISSAGGTRPLLLA